MKKIIFILLFSFMMTTTVGGVDSKNWKNVTIGNNTFKIPPKYDSGKLNENSYQIDNWNNFAILCIDSYIANNYGFEASQYGPRTDLEINGHPARYFCGYNKYEKTELSRIYFASGQSIYCVSYQGSNLSEECKEIVASSDASEISADDFYNILDLALENYTLEEEMDKNTYIPYTSTSSNSHHSDNSFIKYYFFYGMGQLSR